MSEQRESRKLEVLRQLEERGLEHLEEIFDQLLDMAKGLRVLVRAGDAKPFGARFLSDGKQLKTKSEACPTCHRAFNQTHTSVAVEVYEYPPDKALLRYLHEYLAGKAKVKEERQVDPVISVLFPAIDTLHTPETHEEKVMEERSLPDPLLAGARD